MAARVIDGKAVAAAVRERVKVDVEAFREEFGRVPGLATVLVGKDPASEIYVASKRRTTEEVGMRSIHHGRERGDPEEREPDAAVMVHLRSVGPLPQGNVNVS